MGWFRRGDRKDERPDAPDGEAVAATASTDDAAGEADTGQPERKVPAALADLFLVMEEHLNEVELDDARAVVSRVHQPPPLVERLTTGLDEPEELREAILSSPTLSADVLRVVNSAAFALNSPISSIEHAVTYLGTNMVKGLVLQSAVGQVMRFETDVQKAAYMRVWRSSYIASAAAQAFAQHLQLGDPTVHATRALLVNVGDLALISARPELAAIYAPKTTVLHRVEDQQREIMANSAVLSSMLAREWGLPEDLYTALRYALTPLAWAPQRNERSVDAQREDVLLYLACRVGDAVAYSGLRDLQEFDVFDDDSVDFFYLTDYLRALDMGSLVTVLGDAAASRRVRQTLSTFS